MPEVRTKTSSSSLPCQSDLAGRAGQRRGISSDHKSSSCFKWVDVRRVPASHLQRWALEQGEQAAQTSIIFFQPLLPDLPTYRGI